MGPMGHDGGTGDKVTKKKRNPNDSWKLWNKIGLAARFAREDEKIMFAELLRKWGKKKNSDSDLDLDAAICSANLGSVVLLIQAKANINCKYVYFFSVHDAENATFF